MWFCCHSLLNYLGDEYTLLYSKMDTPAVETLVYRHFVAVVIKGLSPQIMNTTHVKLFCVFKKNLC